MKKLLKRVGKTAGVVVGAGIAYDLYYNRRMGLTQSSSNEKPLLLPLKEIETEINWVSEETYYASMTEEVIPALKKQETIDTLSLHNGEVKLAYSHYRTENPIATVIIVHGFNEFKEKYYELIYYLLQANIEVFVYDQRGHGFSKPNAIDSQISINDFYDYIDDLNHFMDEVVIPKQESDTRIMLAHSMGGAVATGYAGISEGQVDALILNAPMFSINTGRIPESLAYLYAKVAIQFDSGNQYIPTTEKYDPEKHNVFRPNPYLDRSDARAKFYYDLNVNMHVRPTRSGSVEWLLASFDALHQIVTPEFFGNVTQPVMLVRSENDQVVNKEGTYSAQKYLPNVENWVVPEGQHENFLDHDGVLKALVSQVIHFVQKNRQEKSH